MSKKLAMKVFYTDDFVLPLSAEHRFPMEKYSMLRKRIADADLVDGKLFCIPHAATDDEISLAHEQQYLAKITNNTLSSKELIRLGLPWTKQLVERSRRSSGATIDACMEAVENGLGINLAGGTHHAFRECGEGYCVFNDSAVAARMMIQEGRVRRVIIIDCDVHQGNGTAAILSNDKNIFTFSIHGRKNFPHDKEISDLDIALEDNTSDKHYLKMLSNGINMAIETSNPDLVIYLAGADPYEDDKFGRLALTKQGLAERDGMVYEFCRKAGLPIAVTMAGGYARDVKDTVVIHFQTVKNAVCMLNH